MGLEKIRHKSSFGHARRPKAGRTKRADRIIIDRVRAPRYAKSKPLEPLVAPEEFFGKRR